MTLPIYVYRCEQCGHQFERTAKMVDPNPPCPKVPEGQETAQEPVPCGGTTKKVIVASTFHLKGSCWASDGYA